MLSWLRPLFALVAGFGACLLVPPVTAQPVPSINVTGGLFNYQINGWQVRCSSNSRSMDLCTGRKRFGRVNVTIEVGDNFLRFEVVAPCLAWPETYATRAWDRRQPIQSIDAARVLLGEMNSRLRRCRRPALPDVTAYEMSDLMFLFLMAVEVPAYVR